MHRHYCTLFNYNYFPRFIVMYESLIRFSDKFTIYVFCMDSDSYNRLLEEKFKNIVPISLEQLEDFDRGLFEVKSTRSTVEYYFTCTPAICNYVFENFKDVNLLTYLDSDLYFFSSPEKIFDEIGEKSIAIVEHRSKSVKNGIYNVAWITLRRDEEGMQCLRKYRDDCLDWCYVYHDNGRYADQKYLDYWPELYNNLLIIKNKGVNLAPWNLFQYNISQSGDTIMVDRDILIFYHFSGIEKIAEKIYTTRICASFIKPSKIVKENIYKPYLTALRNKEISGGVSKVEHVEYSISFIKLLIKKVYRRIRRFIYNDYIILD